ncbi:MAG: alpha/beta fold hydrolase, partial [Nitrospirota bacterium]|nr:alpha/beta fold hydrolase [Nitrospirota bacterium]
MTTPFHHIPFSPSRWLANPHLQTLTPRYRPRRHLLQNIPEEPRLFQVDPESRVLTMCHWQEQRSDHPALVILHGLEGCHDSHYMRGIAHKAWQAGFHVIRFNQRNCGGTEHLTPTLYNGGMSQDIRKVVEELTNKEGIQSIWLTGFSMGGNLVLKMAGEAIDEQPALKGVAAVCPNIHPAACVEALEQRRNWIYHEHFMVKLKAR